jgi:hypothetical protein
MLGGSGGGGYGGPAYGGPGMFGSPKQPSPNLPLTLTLTLNLPLTLPLPLPLPLPLTLPLPLPLIRYVWQPVRRCWRPASDVRQPVRAAAWRASGVRRRCRPAARLRGRCRPSRGPLLVGVAAAPPPGPLGGAGTVRPGPLHEPHRRLRPWGGPCGSPAVTALRLQPCD